MPVSPPLGRRVATRIGEAWFDAALSDAEIERIADYYHRPDPHMDTLIDRTKLPDRATLMARFPIWRWSGDRDQMNTLFALRLDERFVGFTTLQRDSAAEAHSHWHILEPAERAGGLSSAIYPTRIALYFDLLPIERLTHETRVSNAGVNRMLDKYVPVAETVFVEKPSGLAKPGEFHLRYVTRADLPRIIATGERLQGEAS